MDEDCESRFMEFCRMFSFYDKQFNEVLPEEEERHIVGLIAELFSDGKTREEYKAVYEDCRDTIEDILNRYHYCPVTPSSKEDKIQGASDKKMRRMPRFIKMLVYCMAYRAFELYENADKEERKKVAKPSQVGVLNYIGRMEVIDGKKVYKGYKFSNKTFTYFGVSPKIFYNINHYKQAELPMTYAGAKTRSLGYLINYLSVFAGSYQCFVDLFGGAGFASLAVTKQDTVKYFINEYDFYNINFYQVMADDKLYQIFIEKINKIRQMIKEQEFDESYGKEVFEICEKREKEFREKYPIGISDELVSDEIKKSKNYDLWLSETDERKVEAAVAFTYTHSFTLSGGSNEKGAVKSKSLRKFCNYDLSGFDKLHQCFKRMSVIYNCDALHTEKEFIIEYMAKKYSKVLYYSDSPYLNTKGYKGGDIDIEEMHKLIERLMQASSKGNSFIFSCRGMKSIEQQVFDSITSIFPTMANFERDDEGNVLLDIGRVYEDSYYLTKDEWGVRKDVDAKKQMKKVLSLLKANQEIYRHVFCEFMEKAETYKKELYVLICADKKECRKRDENISGMDDKNKVKVMVDGLFSTEVFITDFDYITPPDSDFYQEGIKSKKAKPKEEYTFIKCKLDEFCDLLRERLFRSELYDDVIIKKEGEGYVFKRK